MYLSLKKTLGTLAASSFRALVSSEMTVGPKIHASQVPRPRLRCFLLNSHTGLFEPQTTQSFSCSAIIITISFVEKVSICVNFYFCKKT